MRRLALTMAVFAGALGAGPGANVARAEDARAPVITHLPLMKAQKGEAIVIVAQFKDESEVFAPTLYYRKVGDARFIALAMVKQGGSYGATVPIGAPLEYWFEVYDELGNGPAKVGSSSKPLRIELVEKEKPKAVATKKPKEIPGPRIVHVPVTSAKLGTTVLIVLRLDAKNVLPPTLYRRKIGLEQERPVSMVKEGDYFTSAFVFEAETEYWIEAYDEEGNGPSLLGTDAQPLRIAIEPEAAPIELSTVEVPFVEPADEPFLEGEWLGLSKKAWVAGAAGVLVAGAVAGVAAANSGPPPALLGELVSPAGR